MSRYRLLPSPAQEAVLAKHCNADVNAAINIAAGHPTHIPFPLHAREGLRDAGPMNREPQLLLQST